MCLLCRPETTSTQSNISYSSCTLQTNSCAACKLATNVHTAHLYTFASPPLITRYRQPPSYKPSVSPCQFQSTPADIWPFSSQPWVNTTASRRVSRQSTSTPLVSPRQPPGDTQRHLFAIVSLHTLYPSSFYSHYPPAPHVPRRDESKHREHGDANH